jgi:hypothetical protein
MSNEVFWIGPSGQDLLHHTGVFVFKFAIYVNSFQAFFGNITILFDTSDVILPGVALETEEVALATLRVRPPHAQAPIRSARSCMSCAAFSFKGNSHLLLARLVADSVNMMYYLPGTDVLLFRHIAVQRHV